MAIIAMGFWEKNGSMKMSTTLEVTNGHADPQVEAKQLVVSKKLLNEGADLMQELRLNGIDRRDKEILVINMLDRTFNDQHPRWQNVMTSVREQGGMDKESSEFIVGKIVDHLFERLGPVA